MVSLERHGIKREPLENVLLSDLSAPDEKASEKSAIAHKLDTNNLLIIT